MYLFLHRTRFVKKIDIQNIINTAFRDGFSYINFPMDVDGHASLVSLKIIEGEAILKFYDSLSSKDLVYSDRYTGELLDFIQSCLPDGIQLKQGHETLHLLYQGDAESTGCGYYTIYTAGLIKDREDLRGCSQPQAPIFTDADDPRIRAELALRTLLLYGVENAKKEISQLRLFGKIEHVFQKLGADALNNLIDSIHK